MTELFIKSRFYIVLSILVLLTSSALAQKTIKGQITDATGPLIGATVIVKGTTNGTATDINGNYSITVPNSKSYLIFQYVGYSDISVQVGERSTINVRMKEDAKILEDVVVIGYGTQSKSHLTGAVAKLDADKLTNIAVSDVNTALQGQMTGLAISSQTSEVGVDPVMQVRGIGSISANSAPLIVIDGFPIPDGLSSLNASDIKSVEILKDAASSAIYGSRAANGVIMVTTKSGSSEKPKYSFKMYRGFKKAYKKYDLMNQKEYIDMLELEEANGGPTVPAAVRSAAYLEDQIGATDWQKEGLRTSDITNVQFNIAGGKNATKYFVSAAYTKDEGIMKSNDLDKLTFRSKLSTELSKFLSMGVNVSGTYIKASRPKNNFVDYYRTPSFLPIRHNDFTTALTGYTGFTKGGHFNGIKTPTYTDGTTDENGNVIYTDEVSSPFTSSNNNPECIRANTFRWSESMQGVANVYFEFNITKNLKFKTSNGLNVKFSPSYYYQNKNAIKDGVASSATYNSQLYIDLLTENTLNYSKRFGSNLEHNLEILLGYTAEKTRRQYTALSATGFATDNVQTLNAATVFELASTNNGKSDGTGTFRDPDIVLESYLGRLNYSILDKYLLSTSLRLDRSSIFSKDNRNAWFPSVSLGWRVSEEPFMKNQSLVSNLKLRASYGVTGNNDIEYTAALATLNSANYVLGSGKGDIVSGSANTSKTLANNDITWEQTDEFNYGLDLGILQNRINLSVDAYYSVTRSLLFAQPTQSFTGYSFYWNNIGKIRNIGLEFDFTSYNIRNKNFNWTTNINFSMTRNKVLELGGEERIISVGERSESYLAKVGEPLIQFYGYKTDGIWKNKDEINANPHFSADVPGGLKIVDTNNDGTLNEADRVALGSPYPDFTWGMTNSLSYHNWDLSFLFQGVQGITVYNGDPYYNETWKYNKAYNSSRWSSEAMPGDGKTPYNRSYGTNLCLTDFPLQDASYICLRNLTLGYTFDSNLVKKIGLNNIRLYVTGTNLFYIWSDDFKGIDPEARYTSGNYTSSLISGYQRGGFPTTTTVSAGFDINF